MCISSARQLICFTAHVLFLAGLPMRAIALESPSNPPSEPTPLKTISPSIETSSLHTLSIEFSMSPTETAFEVATNSPSVDRTTGAPNKTIPETPSIALPIITGDPNSVPTTASIDTTVMMPSSAPSRIIDTTFSTNSPSFNRTTEAPNKTISETPSIALPAITGDPSAVPSFAPTDTTFMMPSSAPSRITDTPTSAPTTLHPTTAPSNSSSPSNSSRPSKNPSYFPSNIPSYEPSLSQSMYPTSSPSMSPTMSSQPSHQPSQEPTQISSNAPSQKPSFKPVSSPSSSPTSHPSKMLSSLPSLSMSPTTFPSQQPSSKPIMSPSMLPTYQPSQKPSSKPSYGEKEHSTNNLEMYLDGINITLEDASLAHWIKSMKYFIADFWQNSSNFQFSRIETQILLQELLLTVDANATKGIQKRRMKDLREESKDQETIIHRSDGNSLRIVYTQTYTFRGPEESTLPSSVSTSPFTADVNKMKFLDRLKSDGGFAFANVTTISVADLPDTEAPTVAPSPLPTSPPSALRTRSPSKTRSPSGSPNDREISGIGTVDPKAEGSMNVVIPVVLSLVVIVGAVMLWILFVRDPRSGGIRSCRKDSSDVPQAGDADEHVEVENSYNVDAKSTPTGTGIVEVGTGEIKMTHVKNSISYSGILSDNGSIEDSEQFSIDPESDFGQIDDDSLLSYGGLSYNERRIEITNDDEGNDEQDVDNLLAGVPLTPSRGATAAATVGPTTVITGTGALENVEMLRVMDIDDAMSVSQEDKASEISDTFSA